MSESEDLKAVEAQLAALRPQTGRLDRDRLMFLAGRASCGTDNPSMPAAAAAVPRRRWTWPAIAAGMAALAASLLAVLLVRPQPQPVVQVVERVVEVPVDRPVAAAAQAQGPSPAPQETVGPLPPTAYRLPIAAYRLPVTSYPGLRNDLLAGGVDAWRARRAATDGPWEPQQESYRELRERLLGPAVQ